VREGGDKGVPVVVSNPDSPQAQAFRHVAEEVARQVSIEAMKPELVVLGKASNIGLAILDFRFPIDSDSLMWEQNRKSQSKIENRLREI